MEIEEETKPIIFNSTSSAIKEKKDIFEQRKKNQNSKNKSIKMRKKFSKLKKIIIHPKQKQFENLKK